MSNSSQQSSNGIQPTITDYRIRDIQSFNEATTTPRQVAGLYFFMVLDFIIDLAYAVSHDFFARPHLYTDLDSDIVSTLARLKGQYGFNEFIVAKDHRQIVFSSIFGDNELDWMHNQGEFARHRNNFLEAVGITVERPEFIDAGFVALENRVLRTHRDFKQFLDGFQGGSITWSRDESLAELTENVAYKIFQDSNIGTIFGVMGRVSDNYPYDFDPASNGDKVLENVSKQLEIYDQYGMKYTRQIVSNLIRLGQTGAEGLATIIDFNENGNAADMQLLLDKSYNWLGALMNLSNVPSKYRNNSEKMNYSYNDESSSSNRSTEEMDNSKSINHPNKFISSHFSSRRTMP